MHEADSTVCRVSNNPGDESGRAQGKTLVLRDGAPSLIPQFIEDRTRELCAKVLAAKDHEELNAILSRTQVGRSSGNRGASQQKLLLC